MAHGIKRARTIPRRNQGTVEPIWKWQAKMVSDPKWNSQKVAKFHIGADEVVLTKVSKRAGVMSLRVKDFT